MLKIDFAALEASHSLTPDHQFQMWDGGKPAGGTKTVMVDGFPVATVYLDKVIELKEAAKKDGIDLIVGGGFRVWMDQFNLRYHNVAPAYKIRQEDLYFLLTAENQLWVKGVLTPTGFFSPVTGKPGFSNHQNGRAIDWDTKDPSDPTGNKLLPSYAWLVEHAFSFGWIRTVLSERWHWEYRPGWEKNIVPYDHSTWDGMFDKIGNFVKKH